MFSASPAKEHMQVSFVQFGPVFGDKEGNFSRVEALLKGVEADLLVLPELFATGYAFTSAPEARELSEETEGETLDFLRKMSALTGAAMVAGFAERDGNRIFNSSLITVPGGYTGTYRKIHLFNKEKLWFSPGDSPPPVFDVKGVPSGVMICFDWIFPELCRSLALEGALLIAHPSNLVLPWAQKAMITRCIENRVFAVTANRTGREQRGDDDFSFTGMSQVTGCRGEVLASAPPGEPSVMICGIDPAGAADKSVYPYNHLFNDRRTGMYKL